MPDLTIIPNPQPDPIEHCKGIIYRCRENAFINANGEIVFSTRFTPQKRLSCTGCEKCEWMDEELSESMDNETLDIFDPIRHGELYRLKVTNLSHCHETGYIDDYDFGLSLLRPEEKQ